MKNKIFIIGLLLLVLPYNCKILTERGLNSNDLPRDKTTLADCIPFEKDSDETKAKQTVFEKYQNMDKTSKGNIIPSALVGLFIYEFNKFQKGEAPSNSLEKKMFLRFQSLAPKIKANFECSVNSFNTLNAKAKKAFIPKEFLTNSSLSIQQIQRLLAKEIISRSSESIFNNLDCLEEETPGLERSFTEEPDPNDDVGGKIINFPIIYKINGLRTVHFLPKISGFALRNEEVQRECDVVQQNGEFVQDCHVVVENCGGNVFTASTGVNICMAVPQLQKGGAVLLDGVNFHDVTGTIEIKAKGNTNFTREIQAHVCGDTDVPDTSVIHGVEDKILFTIPEDLPIGVYEIRVVMPSLGNNGGNSKSEPVFLEVVTSPNDQFSIATEHIKAKDETGHLNITGSDEVGIQITTVKLDSDLTVSVNGENELPLIEFGDFDSGEEREMNRVLYNGQNAAVAIGVMGFEIDSREAFEQEVQGFLDAFKFVINDQLSEIFSGALGTVGTSIALMAGASTVVAAAIGTAVVVAVNIAIALWAPADLIIEDTMVFSQLNLGRLTSQIIDTNPQSYSTPGGVNVSIDPVEKNVNHYREDRTYKGDDNSTYLIRYRYNKTN
ncbi:MAG: hypothetical protein ABJM36_14885 [Algibacter sp.]|uniref:hypothetical protein n=1 Tax=Algibacter sp. TaxID=1872428 RepID=UPI0032991B72